MDNSPRASVKNHINRPQVREATFLFEKDKYRIRRFVVACQIDPIPRE
jgi:hypothetical protein